MLFVQSATAQAQALGTDLLIYTVDVEGGQATLLVGPAGSSLLVDAGWPGKNGRDVERIRDAMKDAGIIKIDKLLTTNYHTDHVGGMPELVKRVKVDEFLDHGDNREDSERADYAAYLKYKGAMSHRVVHPGDAINLRGLDIVVLASDGEQIRAVPGIKPTPNSYCVSEPRRDLDRTEDARSAGILVRFGKFSFLDLGDLTKAKELPLVCPENLIGHVDLYLVNHHGSNLRPAEETISGPLLELVPGLFHVLGRCLGEHGHPALTRTLHRHRRYLLAAESFLATSSSSRTTWYLPSSAGTNPPTHAPISLNASGCRAFIVVSDS